MHCFKKKYYQHVRNAVLDVCATSVPVWGKSGEMRGLLRGVTLSWHVLYVYFQCFWITPCWPPGMTEESRHLQLTNQINFFPALCGPSNMNAFTIFIQSSSLVDNHWTEYIRVTRLIWMIKYVQYLIVVWIITSHLENFYDITILPHIKKSKLMNHVGTGGFQSFKVNVRPSSLLMS